MSARTGRYNPGSPVRFKYHALLKAGKVRDTYELAHAAWRAGALSEFRYGARSKEDPTIIWTIGHTEFAQKDYAGVVLAVTESMGRRGIVALELGESWCGYRSLEITYSTGARSVQRWNGHTMVIETVERHLVAVAS